jgi:hypothetical protein
MTHAPTEDSAVPEGDKLKKQPFYTRVWLWLLAIILLIIVSSAVSGGGNDPSGGPVSGDVAGNAADPPAGPTFPGQQKGDTVAAAEQTITLDNVEITTTPLEATTAGRSAPRRWCVAPWSSSTTATRPSPSTAG